MTDIRINLRPWREELREEKKQAFLKTLVGVMLMAVLLIFALDRYYNNALDIQASRNQYIQGKIGLLQARIEAIQLLQQQRRELLERRKVIEELQGNRPITVRLLDELARQMSDDVFFDLVTLQGKTLTIEGVAASTNKIAHQLRNFSHSDWFERPNVTEINAAPSRYGAQAAEFVLTVLQGRPDFEAQNASKTRQDK